MGLQSLERRLERMVDGVFSRRSRNSLKPIELGRRIIRIMDDQRTVDVKGRRVVPNQFEIRLAPSDLEGFADISEVLRSELIEVIREYARDEGYYFMGPVHVTLTESPASKPGRFDVDFQMQQGSPATSTAALVGPTGERVVLTAVIAVIGRHVECDITLSDSNVSRRHAEIHKDPSGWILKDLGSTNGTFVNGTKISSPRYLSDGDIISVAGNNVRFEIS
jgi:hypothetical protein